MQPGKRQVLLRLPAGRRQYPHLRRLRIMSRPRQQDGLAHARIAEKQQHPAFRIWRRDQFPEPGLLRLPADQAHILAGHHDNATLTSPHIGGAKAGS